MLRTWRQRFGIGLYEDAGAGGGGGGNAGAGAGGDGGAGGGAGNAGADGKGGAGGGGDAGSGGQGAGAGAGAGGAGGGAPQNPYQPNDWRYGLFPALSADEKAVKVLDKFKDLPTFVKSHAELEAFQGQSVRIPKADAKPEEWQAFYGKLGRPATPAEYKFERPQLPEGIRISPEAEEMILQTAHEAGLTHKQVEHFFKVTAKRAVAEAENALISRRNAETALNKEWGMEYNKRLALSKKAGELLGEDFVSLLKTTKLADGTLLGNHPGMAKALYGLGLMSQEAGWVVGEVDGITTADAAEKEMDKLMSDPAYRDASKPNHKEICEKVKKLAQLVYGTGKSVPT